jgi:2,3-bisphosphoglycerate-independent phosphoglycerate mutase
MLKINPSVLVILDGFGIGEKSDKNAVHCAKKPNLDKWYTEYPHAILQASGETVGLPSGFMGNSEVGHLTIGSGRIIQQPLTIINNAIVDKSFFKNPLLLERLAELKANGKKLHVMGLLSDAGVHSHEQHLYAFLQAAAQQGIAEVYIHPFLDGRDTAPTSATTYLERLDAVMQREQIGKIGSIHGRFYAMDRDRNWQRTEKSYRVLTEPQEVTFSTWQELLADCYTQGITDEFIPPTQLDSNGIVESGDGVIFFNIREERARQLTACFVATHFNHFPRTKVDVGFFVTPTSYGEQIKTDVLFERPIVKHTLFEQLAAAGKRTFAIAETEKYAHVTYFFNGGKETVEHGEQQVLIPSIIAKKYVEHPEMSAQKITQAVIDSLENDPCDFYLINYANADMVGHSGNFEATVKAVECLDVELGKLYAEVVQKMNGTLYITADHGNAEKNFNGSYPITAHTTNPVPFLALAKKLQNRAQEELPLHQLADIAPFILKNFELPVPPEMVD